LVRAKTVLMATGGGPTMYKYHTPSGDKSMDGLAMAMRRGLALRDMEMVQFHPTGLLAGAGTKMTGTVLEEGLRGAGGHLMNGDQQRFMFDYDAGGERATRDIVSRAIYEEMRQGRTSPHGGVYISMAHLGPHLVAEKFKGMVKRCADSGFDLAAGLVEVVPTAHYLMGGVVVDIDTRTALPGLYVAGEDAGGAHGSNRLGGNGVANSTVYGGVAGDVMGQDCLKMQALHDPDETVLDEEMARATAPFAQKPGDMTALRDKLLDVMWEDVGVMRDAGGLQRGLQRIDEIDDALSSTGVAADNLAFNLSWHDWLNLRSLVDMSRVIAQSALSRENSRGAHFREDHPDAGAMQDSYFTLATGSDKNISVARAPVQFTIVKPGETLLGADEAETLVGAAE
jgi:fumarate reductase flavoprotein subunit